MPKRKKVTAPVIVVEPMHDEYLVYAIACFIVSALFTIAVINLI